MKVKYQIWSKGSDSQLTRGPPRSTRHLSSPIALPKQKYRHHLPQQRKIPHLVELIPSKLPSSTSPTSIYIVSPLLLTPRPSLAPLLPDLTTSTPRTAMSSSVNLPQLLAVLLISGVIIRYFFFSSSTSSATQSAFPGELPSLPLTTAFPSYPLPPTLTPFSTTASPYPPAPSPQHPLPCASPSPSPSLPTCTHPYRLTSPPSRIGSSTSISRRRAIDERLVEQITQMFPQVGRREVLWDLQRNGGSVAATSERILSGGLERVSFSSFLGGEDG